LGLALVHCRAGRIKIIQALLAAGADPDVADSSGAGVLHGVAASEDVDLAKLLLAYGADVNARDKKRLTPLHEAAWADRVEMVRLLLTHGAQVNVADICGDTPLHVAAVNGYEDVFDLLATGGADTHAANDRGQTPFDCLRPKDAPLLIELRVGGKNPYTVIVNDPGVVRQFLRHEDVEFDRIWIPARDDVETIDLKAAIERSNSITTKTWFDRDFILEHLEQYNREYAGFVNRGRRYILCNMDLNALRRNPEGVFTIGSDGGCTLARVIVDPASNTVVRIDCNGG
jgi:hypothetical protein